LFGILVALPVALCSCASDKPVVSRDPFVGPPIRVESAGPNHIIALTAPSSGWGIAFDQSHLHFDYAEVFITVTRPDPALMHTQAQVIQHLDTSVATERPLEVWAKVEDFGSKTHAPYAKAVERAPAR